MQQYVVPQFIDVEGKIIGPITIRQFILLLGGGLALFLAFKFLNFTSFIGVAVLVVILVILFGFMKVQGRPVHLFFRNMVKVFITSPMLKVWNREVTTTNIQKRTITSTGPVGQFGVITSDMEPIVRTRLSELSLIVDTGGAYSKEEEEYG